MDLRVCVCMLIWHCAVVPLVYLCLGGYLTVQKKYQCHNAKKNATPTWYQGNWQLVEEATHQRKRQVPWLNGRIWFRMSELCHLPAVKLLVYGPCCTFTCEHRRKKKEKCPAYAGKLYEENKNDPDPAPRVAIHSEQSTFGTRHTRP